MCVCFSFISVIRDWVCPAVLRLLSVTVDLSLWNKSRGVFYLAEVGGRGDRVGRLVGPPAVHSAQENEEISNWNVEFNCQLRRLQTARTATKPFEKSLFWSACLLNRTKGEPLELCSVTWRQRAQAVVGMNCQDVEQVDASHLFSWTLFKIAAGRR